MRANVKARGMRSDAQVGIGTMIVFIATVLVAAIAAGVLIEVGAKLQERSSRTGEAASKQVASNLEIVRIMGERDNGNAATQITNMTIYVSLAPGASKVDLKQVKVLLSNQSTIITIGYSDDVADFCTPSAPNTATTQNRRNCNGFNITELRDEDKSMDNDLADGGPAVMTSGDLVVLGFNLNANLSKGWNMPLEVRKEISVELLPEIGTSLKADFITPETFGQDTQIQLR